MSVPIQHNSSLSTPFSSPGLSPEQARVVSELAQGRTVTHASAAAGVHRTTVHHWLRTSREFKAAVQHARRHFAACLEDELTDLSTTALKTVRALLEDLQTHPAVRLRVALAVLERPRVPNSGGELPAEIGTRRERGLLRELAEVEADYKRARSAEAFQRAVARGEL